MDETTAFSLNEKGMEILIPSISVLSQQIRCARVVIYGVVILNGPAPYSLLNFKFGLHRFQKTLEY